MFYPYLGIQSSGRDRPKKYAGRVDSHQPDEQYFKIILQDQDSKVFEAQLWVKSLKRFVKVVVVHRLDKNGCLICAEIYFATDPTFNGIDLLIYCKARF